MIDVSQSVEHDHPNALVFLRKDCENAISFFRKNGVAAVPSLQQLFARALGRRPMADGAAGGARPWQRRGGGCGGGRRRERGFGLHGHSIVATP